MDVFLLRAFISRAAEVKIMLSSPTEAGAWKMKMNELKSSPIYSFAKPDYIHQPDGELPEQRHG